MKIATLRSIAVPTALLLVLLLGGCTLGRTRTTTIAPREQTTPSVMTADLETLRREVGQLREEKETLRGRLEAMQRNVAQTQEEQRRYQESMTKNFDLLEQSVALTLSKTITADLAARPATPAAPAMTHPNLDRPVSEMTAPVRPVAAAPAPAAKHTSPAATTQAITTARGGAAAMGLPALGGSSRGNNSAPAASASAMAMPAAMRPAEAAPAVADADLLPPQSPRTLSAHREAKPLYEKGFALFARKDYDQALIVFENFLKRFPDDIYSDNAQFWIGESYLNMNRNKEAEGAYRSVLRDYEHRSTLEGYKTPDAIYRLGQIHQQQGDESSARRFYGALVERFPETSAGRKAQRELATIGINTAAR